ncbi:hypothetical protein [Flavobacterium cerinum]|uniref:DUF3830 family protein n=1 Tax=Flavobacterium cerinum TaxID=2502784 RepID=A0ABY5INZ3_9FLAO|nr:hypothetical protein [Flavobacterium cerinum]UUC44558.1 hypothetical protein NOX80_13060 [Flavobacterium cerinum]
METVKYKDWEFEVDRELTIKTYKNVTISGAESCICDDCKNYILYRDTVFPEEIKQLFNDLGIDLKKEVEIVSYETLPNGFQRIGGWFHFKGKLLNGNNCYIPIPDGYGFTIYMTKVVDDFSIGFTKANALTFFEKTEDLVQVEFLTSIPMNKQEEIKN